MEALLNKKVTASVQGMIVNEDKVTVNIQMDSNQIVTLPKTQVQVTDGNSLLMQFSKTGEIHIEADINPSLTILAITILIKELSKATNITPIEVTDLVKKELSNVKQSN